MLTPEQTDLLNWEKDNSWWANIISNIQDGRLSIGDAYRVKSDLLIFIRLLLKAKEQQVLERASTLIKEYKEKDFKKGEIVEMGFWAYLDHLEKKILNLNNPEKR